MIPGNWMRDNSDMDPGEKNKETNMNTDTLIAQLVEALVAAEFGLAQAEFSGQITNSLIVADIKSAQQRAQAAIKLARQQVASCY